MASKKLNSIDEVKGTFEEYFKEDLEAIEEELLQSKKYSVIIDKEIENLSAPSLGSNRGSQHYLIEHINNAVALQTQRQGLRKDRFAIKKAIMDYSAKFADNTNNEGTEDLSDLLKKLIDKDKTVDSTRKTIVDEDDLDSAIDEILDGNA